MQNLEKNFLIINKPVGWTSFDVVGYIKKLLRQKDPKFKKIKIGHAGTLDPFATGVLIVGIGREATKRLDEFKNLPKTYRATVRLGWVSTTDDKDGEIKKFNETIPTEEQVQNTLKEMKGKQEQIPPMYSAKKVNGTRLYKLARKGIEIERKPVSIEIYNIKKTGFIYPDLEIEVSCSAGTYVRTIAKTIGEKLGTGAYCESLQRSAVGEYSIDSAVLIEGVAAMLDNILFI